MTTEGHFHGGPFADSAGQPFAGRTLAPAPFPGDDGTCPPALASALAAARNTGDLEPLVAELTRARVLTPIIAVPGETGVASAPDGRELTVDKSSDMAVITVTSPQGTVALPIFSSIAALADWNSSARPVPVEGARAAQAAVSEKCSVLVLDPAATAPVVIPRAALLALAAGREWIPSPRDAEVAAALGRSGAAVEAIRGVRSEPGRNAELRVVLDLEPGLDSAALERVATAFQEAIAAESAISERVSSLEISLAAAAR